MMKAKRMLAGICVVLAGAATVPANAAKQVQAFNDTRFEMQSCEITADRTAVCTLTVTSLNTDKGIEISHKITIQDNHGTDFPVTGGGFGDPSGRPQWSQIAVADTSYTLTVVATNISTKSESVRAVVFNRLLVRSMQRQVLGYRDQAIFAKPRMISRQAQPAAPVLAAPAEPAAPPAAPAPEAPADDAMLINPDEWQVVGLWNYDGEDGQHVPSQGFVFRKQAGAALGAAWLGHIELRNHARLSERQRSLWPVMIHMKKRKVCADYPGYPTYPVFIDMPGDVGDAVYEVSACKPD